MELGDHTRGISLRFWNLTKAPTTSGTVLWFEFIDFRSDIVVGSPFQPSSIPAKASPKITLRGFHQPSHQIFWQSVESSVLMDFGVDRISEVICRDHAVACMEKANTRGMVGATGVVDRFS
jgi:hypothetical protein